MDKVIRNAIISMKQFHLRKTNPYLYNYAPSFTSSALSINQMAKTIRSINQRYSSRLYKPLNPKTSEIRLLKLPQSSSSEFELVPVSLDDRPKYAALSYLWGNPEHYGEITIEGNTVRIPDNLASIFLRVLSDEPFRTQPYCQYLWADAICISQKDVGERSQQVQPMRRIFQAAHVTFA